MFKETKNAISVIYTFIRFILIKLIRFKEFSYHGIERFSPNTMINIWRGGKLSLGRKVRAHTNVRLSVTTTGTMTIGNDVRINYNCIFVCQKSITIGNGVEFGPGVIIYDHDHDYSCPGGVKAGKFKQEPVSIGDNSWIGANTVILRGTTIGKNCVIGAGCVVKGVIPDNAVYIQKRESVMKPIET